MPRPLPKRPTRSWRRRRDRANASWKQRKLRSKSWCAPNRVGA
jgi:hypothetical protein